jgi:hypothetical protein
MKKLNNYRNNDGVEGHAYKLDPALTLRQEVMAFIFTNEDGKRVTRFVKLEDFKNQYQLIENENDK